MHIMCQDCMIFIGFMHVNYRLDLFAYPGTPCTIMIQGVIEAIIVNIEDNIDHDLICPLCQ